jgi:peptidyl-prolyl cis-trans isomerase C
LTVNGSPITEKDVENILARTQSQGRIPTQQMREQAITEIAVQRVMLEEARRLKLDAAPAFLERLENMRQMALIEALAEDYLARNPITEADERAEYDRQRKILGNGSTTLQYQLRQIIVRSEQEGRDLIARAQKGESFEKLVDASIDQATRTNGGMIGWVFPTDLLPILGAVVVNLQKGAVSAAPIQTGAGWHVLKLDDTRSYKIPTFEEARMQMKQGVLTQRRQALIDDLMKKAVVKRP